MKNNTKLVVSAAIVTIAIMFAFAMVTVASTQSVSAIRDPDQKSIGDPGIRTHDGVRGISDPDERIARG